MKTHDAKYNVIYVFSTLRRSHRTWLGNTQRRSMIKIIRIVYIKLINEIFKLCLYVVNSREHSHGLFQRLSLLENKAFIFFQRALHMHTASHAYDSLIYIKTELILWRKLQIIRIFYAEMSTIRMKVCC